MYDLIAHARELLAAVDDAEHCDALQLAQVNALVSIAESLARIVDAAERRAPIGEHRDRALRMAGETVEQRAARYGRTVEEQQVLDMPKPKGYACPACKHPITVHRMHGCDTDGCDCPQPHGRILPGDPDPAT